MGLNNFLFSFFVSFNKRVSPFKLSLKKRICTFPVFWKSVKTIWCLIILKGEKSLNKQKHAMVWRASKVSSKVINFNYKCDCKILKLIAQFLAKIN